MTNTTATTLTPGTRVYDRNTGGYMGVIRQGRKVVFECGHRHHNRDTSTGLNGTSARDCAKEIILAAKLPDFAKERAAGMRNAWQGLTRCGFYVSKSTIDKTKEQGEQNAAAFLDAVAQIRAIINA